MIIYLVKKYLTLALLLTIAFTCLPLILHAMPIRDATTMGILLSGIISPAVIYREFHYQKLWPLYHNLRLPKFLLLGLFSGIQIAVFIGLRIWIR